jgi:hypothetical protein
MSRKKDKPEIIELSSTYSDEMQLRLTENSLNEAIKKLFRQF